MNYIYGDAAEAPFSIDYLQLLRDVLEFSVAHLLAEQQRLSLSTKELSVRSTADAEVKRIEELGRLVQKTIESANVGADGSALARAAQSMVRATGEQVRLAIDGVRAHQSQENAALAEQERLERERSKAALEKLLLAHDLPDTSFSQQLSAQASSRYVGRVATTSGMGVDAVIELEIAKEAGALTPIARVERFVPGIDLATPESGGWLRKETRLRPQRIDKLCVIELASGEGGTLKLRANPDGTGAGFDLRVLDGGKVGATHTNEKGETQPFELPAEDVAKVVQLHAKVAEAAAEARFFRKRVVELTLDGDAFVDHDEPTVLIERLIEEMAPVVQEIARRSKSTDELVIKRITGDKRREEIFIAKAELLATLAPVPQRFRQLFASLGLEESRPSTRPAPIARPSSKRPPPIPEAPSDGAQPVSMPPAVSDVSSSDWEIPEPVEPPPSKASPPPLSSTPAIAPPPASGSPKPPPTSKRS